MGAKDSKPVQPENLEIGTLKWVNEKKPENPDAGSIKEEPLSFITPIQVATDHGVPRNVFMNYLNRQVEESKACWSLPFTLLLVVSYATVAITHDNAEMLRAVEESLDHDIMENSNFAFTGDYMGHKGIDDVNSVADFWSWMSNGLIPLLFVQSKSWHEGADDNWYANANNSKLAAYQYGLWLNYNRIVGGVRVRQERSANEACKSVKSLLAAYDMPCVGGLGAELDPEIRAARFTAEPVREVWLYVDDDMASLQTKLWEMERTKWFDRNTKKIEISIPAYNGELGMHVMIYCNFFISRGGHIWKKLMPLGFASNLHPYWYYWIGDAIWVVCVFYIFAAEILDIYTTLKRQGFAGLVDEYINFWNAFDWFSMMCAFTVMAMFGAVIGILGGLNDSLRKLDAPEKEYANSTMYRKGLHEHIDTLESTVQYVNNFRMVMASYPLIIILRLFKAYSAQPRLAMVTNTIGRAGLELIEFGVVFFSVFITFTISGVVLFGREVVSFGTFNRALFASFRLILGDLLWDETSQVGRAFALLWLFLFMVVNVMLLLNMLLAIIMKHYVAAKDSAGNAEPLWVEAAQTFQRWREVRRGESVPMEKLLDVLNEDEHQRAKERKKEEEEDTHIETDEEIELKVLGKIMFAEDMQQIYSDAIDEGVLPIDQVLNLMKDAVSDFYHQNHSGIDMDEVLKLTRKVEYRTRKLLRISKELDKSNKCPNEIGAFSNFIKDLETFTDEQRSEYESHCKQVDEMRTLKRGLLLQLQCRQSLGEGAIDDPTSVSALLSSSNNHRYDWKIGSRFSDTPHDDDDMMDADYSRVVASGRTIGSIDLDNIDASFLELDIDPLSSQQRPIIDIDTDEIAGDRFHVNEI